MNVDKKLRKRNYNLVVKYKNKIIKNKNKICSTTTLEQNMIPHSI